MGFYQSSTLDKWLDYDKHTCHKNGSCPQTIRSTEDSHVFFIGFPHHPSYTDTASPRTQAIRYPYYDSMTWNLAAGKLCKDQRPYVKHLRASSHTFPYPSSN